MTDRLVIEIAGNLPDEGKYGILAKAEFAAKECAETLTEDHGLVLSVSVRAVRPSKKSAAPIVQATTLASEPMRQRPAAE